jgi:TetR/AcrR family transcriptional regulator, transcriptional repressor for nem operon
MIVLLNRPVPRLPALQTADVVNAAMRHFWLHGYHATSMDELVEAIGVSRHAIYSGVGSKHELYRRGFAAYQILIVTPAFGCVEEPDAGLDAIGCFFETQIASAEYVGFPGPGCLVANAATETAPHDPLIAQEVASHNARLKAGFANALTNENSGLSLKEIGALADFLLVTAQGLWSMSRTVTSASPLRAHVSTTLSLLRARLQT